MEWLKGVLETLLGSTFAWGAFIALVLAKFLPNTVLDKVGGWVGTALTLWLSKFSWWQKIEDWLIDGLAVFVTAIIKGLRSDNPPD